MIFLLTFVLGALSARVAVEAPRIRAVLVVVLQVLRVLADHALVRIVGVRRPCVPREEDEHEQAHEGCSEELQINALRTMVDSGGNRGRGLRTRARYPSDLITGRFLF